MYDLQCSVLTSLIQVVHLYSKSELHVSRDVSALYWHCIGGHTSVSVLFVIVQITLLLQENLILLVEMHLPTISGVMKLPSKAFRF